MKNEMGHMWIAMALVAILGILVTVTVIKYRIGAIESQSIIPTLPQPTAPAVAPATAAEVSSDLKHCAEIAQTIRNGMAITISAISTSDAAGLATVAEISDGLAQGLMQDGAPPPIRSISQHAKFMSDASDAAGALAEFSKDAANYLGGDSSVKYTDLRQEAAFAKDAADTVNHDLRSYRRFAQRSEH